jgi:hypothetical protein
MDPTKVSPGHSHKYQTQVEINNRNKHNSLLQCYIKKEIKILNVIWIIVSYAFSEVKGATTFSKMTLSSLMFKDIEL